MLKQKLHWGSWSLKKKSNSKKVEEWKSFLWGMADINMFRQFSGGYSLMNSLISVLNIGPAVTASLGGLWLQHTIMLIAESLYTQHPHNSSSIFQHENNRWIYTMHEHVHLIFLFVWNLFPVVIFLNSFNNTINFQRILLKYSPPNRKIVYHPDELIYTWKVNPIKYLRP